jgi:hypothetical protein
VAIFDTRQTIWNLDNKDSDVASFTLRDTLTCWSPHGRGGILHVHTNDICVLRGIRGAYSIRACDVYAGNTTSS